MITLRQMIMNALVLFGWALILPPMLGDRADIGAPVNEWDVLRKGFATAHDCDKFRANDQVIWQGSGSKPGVVNVYVPPVPPQQRAAARCVPDDDPRLGVRE